MIKGLRQLDALAIEQALTRHGRFESVGALRRGSGVSSSCLRRLASADAFGSMGADRQGSLWQIQALRDEAMPLFECGGNHKDHKGRREKNAAEVKSKELSAPLWPAVPTHEFQVSSPESRVPNPESRVPSSESRVPSSEFRIPDSDSSPSASSASLWPDSPDSDSSALLPPVSEFQKVMQDYDTTGLSLRQHPMAFLRPVLTSRGVITTECVRNPASRHGGVARVAGIVLVRQRPSSASGVLFLTIEDETGAANIILRPAVVQRFKKALAGGVLLCAGKIERVGEVVHVMATDIQDISGQLRDLPTQSRNYR
jgi:DNA polymerase III alpha subunit